VERTGCASSSLGVDGISAQSDNSAWNGRQPCVFAASLSSLSSACVGDGAVGHDVFATALSFGHRARMVSGQDCADRPRVLQVWGWEWLGLALLFGAVRLAMPEGQTVRVGLIASDEKENNAVVDPGEETERLFRNYANAAHELTEKGARRPL
jgi:hypothetical protein